MWDTYDPRSADNRERIRGDRNRASRGSATDRGRNDERRDVFTKGLDLPRGHRGELVRDRARVYEINGAESRTLATIGAFRVIGESDLNDASDERRPKRSSTISEKPSVPARSRSV